jgi:hypothetical protein
MNNITIELCQEDRERLDKLTATLDKFGQAIGLQVAWVELPQGGQTTDDEPTPAEQPAAPAPAPAEQPAASAVSLPDLQQLVIALTNKGHKAQVRDIVKAYAERVGLIPEDKRAEVFDKLKALEG